MPPAARDDAVGQVEDEGEREQQERTDEIRIVPSRLEIVETEEDCPGAPPRAPGGGEARGRDRAQAPPPARARHDDGVRHPRRCTRDHRELRAPVGAWSGACRSVVRPAYLVSAT